MRRACSVAILHGASLSPRSLRLTSKGRLPVMHRRTRVSPRALGYDFLISQSIEIMDQLSSNLGNAVVVQSETNTVGISAEFCFAEFGGPLSYDAPNLVDGTEADLTDDQRELAVCLATPFEGNPEEEGTRKEADIIEREYLSMEFERRYLGRLMAIRRQKKLMYLMTRFLMHLSQFLALDKAIHFMQRHA